MYVHSQKIGTLTSLGASKPKGFNMITKSAKVTYVWGRLTVVLLRKVEDTNRVIRSGKSKKDRQHNGQKKKDKQLSTKHCTENQRSSNTNSTKTLFRNCKFQA